jgi:hypothetical protein
MDEKAYHEHTLAMGRKGCKKARYIYEHNKSAREQTRPVPVLSSTSPIQKARKTRGNNEVLATRNDHGPVHAFIMKNLHSSILRSTSTPPMLHDPT